MMKRTYLEEDVQLIQKYFPGAKAVTLRTPFDLTARGSQASRLSADSFRDDEPNGHWHGDLLWSR
jgi:hypothetical protein